MPSFSGDEQLHSQRGAAVLAATARAPARIAGGDCRRLFRLDSARFRAREMERHYGRRVCGNARREPGRASRLGVARLLRCVRMPLLAGRDFKAEDNENAPRVMIVNESFAQRFFEGRDPVGRRVQIYGKPFTIVGMVKDSKYLSLSEAPQPYFYMSFDQVHYGSGENGVAFYARTDRDARGFVPVLRREMSAIDPNSAGLTAMALSDYISAAWFGPRLASFFLGVLGVIAMLLAGVGLYGVMAYSVYQRTREIGIRMALGADPEGVLRMVMRRGLLLALSGIAAGLVIALATAPQIAPLLYHVSPADPVSIAGAALFLIVVAVIASLIPALRATRVDPILALNEE